MSLINLILNYPDARVYVESQHDYYECKVFLGAVKDVIPTINRKAIKHWEGDSDSIILLTDGQLPLINTPPMKHRINADNHPYSCYHRGMGGGYAFMFEGGILTSIHYESYRGSSGGGTVWEWDSGEWSKAVEMMKSQTFTNDQEREFIQSVIQNSEKYNER